MGRTSLKRPRPKRRQPNGYVEEEESLTDKERAFCAEYPIDYNAARAARAAGYKNAGVMGYKLLKRPHVQAVLRRIQRANMRQADLNRERVLQELTHSAFLDMGQVETKKGWIADKLKDLPEEVRRAIKILDVEQMYNKQHEVIGQRIRIVPNDKIKSLELAMKHFGLLAPQQVKVEVEGAIEHTHVLTMQDVEDLLPLDVKKKILERLREKMKEQEKEESGRTIDAVATQKRISSVKG